MRRVVVTGMGIVSSIGNTLDDVRTSLRNARSGIIAAPEYAELGFRCQVHAAPDIDWEAAVDRRPHAGQGPRHCQGVGRPAASRARWLLRVGSGTPTRAPGGRPEL